MHIHTWILFCALVFINMAHGLVVIRVWCAVAQTFGQHSTKRRAHNKILIVTKISSRSAYRLLVSGSPQLATNNFLSPVSCILCSVWPSAVKALWHAGISILAILFFFCTSCFPLFLNSHFFPVLVFYCVSACISLRLCRLSIHRWRWPSAYLQYFSNADTLTFATTTSLQLLASWRGVSYNP